MNTYTPSEIKYLWKHRGNKTYELKCLKTTGNDIKTLLFEDVKNCRDVSGKIVISPREGEAYHWPRLKHDNLAPLLDIVSINERVSIHISTIFEKSIKSIIHESEFVQRSDCMYRKKAYAEDILWALDYLHSKRLCLMNLNDANIYISCVKDKAIITDFSCLMLAERAKKCNVMVPFLYRAPELDVQSSDSFDAVAAEMWACGVMMLQIFTGHIMSRDETNVNYVLKTLKNLNVAVLISANAGNLHMTDEIVNHFKQFLNIFFKMEPKSRTTAKSAAISSFLQNKHFSTYQQYDNISEGRELKIEAEKNVPSNELNARPQLVWETATNTNEQSHSMLKRNFKKFSPKHFLNLQYGSNKQKLNDEMFRLSLRDYEPKPNIKVFQKCKVIDESVKLNKNLSKIDFQLFNTEINEVINKPLRRINFQTNLQNIKEVFTSASKFDIDQEKDILRQNSDCASEVTNKMCLNKNEENVKSILLSNEFCDYNPSKNTKEIYESENVVVVCDDLQRVDTQYTGFVKDSQAEENIERNDLNKKDSSIGTRNTEKKIHHKYNIPTTKENLLPAVRSASDSLLCPNVTINKNETNSFRHKNNSYSEIFLTKKYSIINLKNDLLLNRFQSYPIAKHTNSSSSNNNPYLSNPSKPMSDESYFSEGRNTAENDCFKEWKHTMFYRTGELIDNSETNKTLKRKTIFEDSISHPFTINSLYIETFIQNNKNLLCNILNAKFIDRNLDLENISTLNEDQHFEESPEIICSKLKVNVNSFLNISDKVEYCSKKITQTDEKQNENIDPNTELLTPDNETDKSFSFCRRYSYELAMSHQVESYQIIPCHER